MPRFMVYGVCESACMLCMVCTVHLTSLTQAQKEWTHQLALPWGIRHLISPESAGKDVMILLLVVQTLVVVLTVLRTYRDEQSSLRPAADARIHHCITLLPEHCWISCIQALSVSS